MQDKTFMHAHRFSHMKGRFLFLIPVVRMLTEALGWRCEVWEFYADEEAKLVDTIPIMREFQ